MVMTVGMAMTVPNKFRLCAVLMLQTVITLRYLYKESLKEATN